MAKSMLYTRTGDAGTTSLVGGERVLKNCLRLDSYGEIDELSSWLGVAAADPACPAAIREELQQVQNELFNIGCYLATAVAPGSTPECPSLSDGSKIEKIEKGIDRLDEATPKIRAFVLPGGSQTAGWLHLGRTVCRRAERVLHALASEEYVDPAVLKYINRLSDYLFIAARYANHEAGVEEITWKQS